MNMAQRAPDLPLPRDVDSSGLALDYLGPAEITNVEGTVIEVSFGKERSATARLALASPYEPVPGDMVVVIGAVRADGESTDFYVIGVIHGAGQTKLAFDGDVELAARGGKLRLVADEGIELKSKAITTVTSRLRTVAEVVHRSYGQVHERVRGLLNVHAGSEQRLIDQDSVSKARSTTILTEEEMTINGKRIHLG